MSPSFGLDRPNAMVLSGGGANAAYEVGVVKALSSGASAVTGNQALEPAIYTGTSAGAFNAAVLTSWPEYSAFAASEYLERLWLEQIAWGPERCGNGMYRIRGDGRRLFDPACGADPAHESAALLDDAVSLARDFFRHATEFVSIGGSLGRRTLSLVDLSMFVSRSPLEALVQGALRPAAIRASTRLLRIAVTEWTSGQLRVFSNADMTDQAATFIVLASAAIPGFFVPVTLDGDVYVDGGVVMDTPLLPAIQAGAEVIHVIYPDPDVRNIPVEVLRTAYGAFDRTLTIGRARAINQDADTVRRINEGLDVLEALQAGRLPAPAGRRALLSAARSIAAVSGRGTPYKKVIVHRYHPRYDLGGVTGLLNTDHDRVRDLIDKGFEDTVNHDCVLSDCIL